jgi:hypothetical protein
LFFVTIKLKKKNIDRKRKTDKMLSKAFCKVKSPENSVEEAVPKKKQKNRPKQRMKLIGLDFSKKLASIVSFVIFAV